MPTALNRSIDNAIDAIFGAFETYWTANDNTPVAWPNMSFDPKNSANANGWVRVTFTHVTGSQETLGSQLYRRNGVLIFQVFTRANEGRGNNDALSESIIKWLESSLQDEFFWVRNPTPVEVGTLDAWYQTNISADVVYDVIR